jgi:hypothetical protein
VSFLSRPKQRAIEAEQDDPALAFSGTPTSNLGSLLTISLRLEGMSWPRSSDLVASKSFRLSQAFTFLLHLYLFYWSTFIAL